MDDDDEIPADAPASLPGWLATFADLMSLLMCFFVLLLTFSELKVEKFKQLAGSMKQAFGVQRDTSASDIPMGISVVAQHFSAAKPQPTIAPQVKQKTTEIEKKNLDINEGKNKQKKQDVADKKQEVSVVPVPAKEVKKQDTPAAQRVKEMLKKEIESSKVEVETEDNKIVIRLLEKNAFSPGLAEFNYDFYPVLDKIRVSLADVEGKIIIAGHTDDGVVVSHKFRSNWDLSAARAVSVAQVLMEHNPLHPEQIKLDAARFAVVGYAGVKPRVANNSDENRASNRRIEIIVEQSAVDLKPSDQRVAPDDETLEDDWIEENIFEKLSKQRQPKPKQ